WRPALIGAAGALVTLAAIIALFGRAIGAIPVDYLQIVVGTALLLFGIRWLRKAILRSAGVVAHHDESAKYAEETRALRLSDSAAARWDPVAMLTAYKAVVLEGVEVVVIVLGVGAVGHMLLPATIGALVACTLVAIADVRRAMLGLFFDDGKLALEILVLLGSTAAVASAEAIPSWRSMTLLVAGTLVILLENVVRAVRNR